MAFVQIAPIFVFLNRRRRRLDVKLARLDKTAAGHSRHILPLPRQTHDNLRLRELTLLG